MTQKCLLSFTRSIPHGAFDVEEISEDNIIKYRGTLDEGPRGMVQKNGTILLSKSHKLDPRPLNEDLKPIQANLKCHLHNIILEGNSIGLN